MAAPGKPAVWTSGRMGPLPFAGLLAIGELLVWFAFKASAGPLPVWVFGHAALVALAAVVLVRQRTAASDESPYVLALIATTIAGPIGAILAVGAVVLLARERPDAQLLAAWYERIALAGDIDQVTNLCNTVAMGRGVLTTAVPPPEFERVMTGGSLEDRQTALGLIARQFSPSYAAALRLALVSPEPVIRVQAAAVAVKVRAQLKVSLQAALTRLQHECLPPDGAAALALELQGMVRSGLLEDEDRSRGEEAIEQLLVMATSAMPAGAGQGANELDAAGHALLESELLRQGRFDEFRTARLRSGLGQRMSEGLSDA